MSKKIELFVSLLDLFVIAWKSYNNNNIVQTGTAKSGLS